MIWRRARRLPSSGSWGTRGHYRSATARRALGRREGRLSNCGNRSERQLVAMTPQAKDGPQASPDGSPSHVFPSQRFQPAVAGLWRKRASGAVCAVHAIQFSAACRCSTHRRKRRRARCLPSVPDHRRRVPAPRGTFGPARTPGGSPRRGVVGSAAADDDAPVRQARSHRPAVASGFRPDRRRRGSSRRRARSRRTRAMFT